MGRTLITIILSLHSTTQKEPFVAGPESSCNSKYNRVSSEQVFSSDLDLDPLSGWESPNPAAFRSHSG